jgi:hypothetical protein
MEKHEETRYVKRTQITQCLLNYNLFKKLNGDSLPLQKRQSSGIQNRTTVVQWLKKFGNFDWENKTPFSMSKSPEQKIMDLRPK